MITREKVYFDAGINQVGDGGKYFHITLRDDIPVFVPEIPDITEEIQGFRLFGRDILEEFHEAGLARLGILDIQAKVHVGGKI